MAKKQFRIQQNGYHKGQVDKYIRELQKAYQEVYMEYLELRDKNQIKNKKVSHTIRYDTQYQQLLTAEES